MKTSVPDKIIDVNKGLQELFDAKGIKNAEQLRKQLAACCLQLCECCLQLSAVPDVERGMRDIVEKAGSEIK